MQHGRLSVGEKLMLFNHSDIIDAASRRIAPGLPATPGERAAIDAKVFAETQMSLSAQSAIDREYERYISDIEETTGKRLFNPMRMRAVGAPGSLEDQEARFMAERDKLIETHDIAIRTPQSIRDDIAASVRTSRLPMPTTGSRNWLIW